MINTRIQQLRTWMEQRGIDVLVVPTMDPHNSEYVPEHWKCRQWITGFTGSAGTAVITSVALESEDFGCRLWTDSRYWLQATDQLAGTPIILMREGEDTPIDAWLGKLAEKHIAFPADMMTPELYSELFVNCHAEACAEDPFDALWSDRPAMPLSKAEMMPDELAGESAASKLNRLVEWIGDNKPHGELFVSELSEICWLLNLRGNDIPYNPFLICFFKADINGRHILYIHSEQITPETTQYFAALGIEVRPYAEGLDIQQHRLKDTPDASPIAEWRAIKNEAEQQGFREAHIRDGVAMVRFLCWLDNCHANEEGVLTDKDANVVTEIKVDEVLTAFRAEQQGFCGLSFETIAAYGPHGAIVHYEATPETDVPLEARSLLLLDSGAHYSFPPVGGTEGGCGTTDITRTIALGELTDEERRVYTLVLKGHLQLAHLHFPDGTTGLQLDTAARMAMWREGYDFGHGTGHGVGHRLGVHEGPVQIRKNLRACTTLPFHAGQNITDEPGIYVPGRFGVRIENILFAVPAVTNESPDGTTDFGRFLRFEQHTLCPYDQRPIVVEMLTPEERRWLNDYHAHVREVLTPLLPTDEERQWLVNATRAL